MLNLHSPGKEIKVLPVRNSALRFRSIFFLFLGMLQLPGMLAQSVANYSVTRTTGITYTSIASTGTSFIWRNTSGGATNDDNRSIATPIGFDFWYLGVRYTSFSASTNGFIDFSSSTNVGTAGSAYGPLNGNEFSSGGTGGTMLALAPMYNDLWPSNAGASSLASYMKYAVTGTAPNRVLTVEWIDAEIYKANPYWTTPPDLNFQVKLFESSGQIKFVYGNMTIGTGSHNYALGINNFWTPAATPTASQHLTQQTANTTSFGPTPQDALTIYPTSTTEIVFTPPAPSAAPSALSFSNVTKTSMDLFWTDNATNELGYVILNSTDNTTFNFVSQLAAGSSSAAVSSLSAGTTYYWRVHALTEGDLGTALTGTQATASSGTIISITSGNWNTSSTWNCTCIPTAGDYVTIANSHVVTLDVNGACRQLTVGQGTSGQLTIGNNSTGRNLTVGGDIIVSSGGTLTLGNANATHQMTVSGNISNAGILNLSTTANRVCNVTFNRNGNQTISGAGATTFFNRIIMDMGTSASNMLEITTATFGVRPTNFLTLTNGTFKLSAPAGTITPFTGATTLTTTTGLWLNNAGSVLNFGNTITLFSSLRVSAGTMQIGDANNENLVINGGSVIVDGGNLNVAGRLARSGLTARIDFLLSSGNVVVGTVGSTTGSEAIFRLDESGSSFSMSGGSITLRRSGASNLGWENTSTTNVSVTGGTLFLGDASSPASPTITLNSRVPLHNLTIGTGVAVTASLLTNSVSVNNNVTISSGTFIANNLPISLGGNWRNDGGFSAGTSSVVFESGSAQTISGVSTTTFNSLTLNNSNASGLSCSSPVYVTGTLNLISGLFNTSTTNLLYLEAGSAATAGNANSYVNGPMQKTGTTAFVFPVGKSGRRARIGIGAPTSSTSFRAEYFASGYGAYGIASSPTPALNNVSTKEHWMLDRVAGTGDAAVTLYWEDASFSEINDCSTSDLRVAHYNSVINQWQNPYNSVSTAGTCTGSSAGSVSTNTVVSSFSPFTFGSLTSLVNPLPIELIDLRAEETDALEVEVSWETASEYHNDYYTVQRSKDGYQFEDLGQVDAKDQPSRKQQYHYFDKDPYEGLSYYRLKQTDLDAHFDYTKMVAVTRSVKGSLRVFPNPTEGRMLQVEMTQHLKGVYRFELLDMSGRVVYETEQRVGESDLSSIRLFPGSDVRAGVYTLKAIHSTSTQVCKVIFN